MTLSILEYLDRAGSSPFAAWFRSVDAAAAAKVTTALRRLSWGTSQTSRAWVAAYSSTESISDQGIASTLAKTAMLLSSCSAVGRRSARTATSRPPTTDGPTTRSARLRRNEMPLTREFKETVQARLRADRKYRKELLREGVESLLAGDLDTGKAILRDYINATIGFEELSRRTKRPAKSLMRMLGPSGNPQARNLFEVLHQLQRAEGLHFELSLRAAS